MGKVALGELGIQSLRQLDAPNSRQLGCYAMVMWAVATIDVATYFIISPVLLQLTAVRHQRRSTSSPAFGAERCRLPGLRRPSPPWV